MKDGEVLGWLIIDYITGEWVMRCDSRAQARELAGDDGFIAVVRGAH